MLMGYALHLPYEVMTARGYVPQEKAATALTDSLRPPLEIFWRPDMIRLPEYPTSYRRIFSGYYNLYRENLQEQMQKSS